MRDVSDVSSEWTRIDEHLFRGERIQAIASAAENLGLSVGEAQKAVHEHWTRLTQETPASFKVPLAGYWDGVYS